MSALTGFWRGVEALHDVVYFAPGTQERFEALGLRGWWMSYFATRAASLGTPPATVVTATFHNFSPSMVERSVPECWDLADRQAILDERLATAREALDPGLSDSDEDAHDVAALARRLAQVRAGADLAGKPLAAAEAALPVPSDPVGALWRHASVLRELRGDCHVAVLVTAGLDGCLVNALQVALGRAPERQRVVRGWTEEEWAASLDDLRGRGWVDADGRATETGTLARDRLEDATDRAVAAALDTRATAAAVAVTDDLLAAARDVVATGAIPYPNPVGVPAP